MRRTALAALTALTLVGCGGDLLAPRLSKQGGNANARPAPGTLTTWAVSSTSINLAWDDNATNESGWEAWRSTTGVNGTFTLLVTLGANVTSYLNTGLTPLTEYCYKVRSFKKQGQKNAYNEFFNTSCSTTPGPPPAPSNTNAVFGDNSFATVTWTDNSATEDVFRIERSGSASGPWTQIAELYANTTSYNDWSVTTEQLYCYRVIAHNQWGDSPSNVDCTSRPNAPLDVKAVSNDANSVDVTWTDNSAFEEHYVVERALDDYVFSIVATLDANTSTYHDNVSASDVRYWYRVRATSSEGKSYYSNYAGAVPVSTPPGVPTLTNAYPSNSTNVYAYGNATSVNTKTIRVERSTAGGAWVSAGTVEANADLSWDFAEGNLTTEQEVCYRAVGINSVGESAPSAEDCTAPPAAPSDIYTVPIDEWTTEVRWTNNSAVADGVLLVTYYCDYSWDYYCEYPYEYDYYLGPTETSYTISSWETVWYVCATKDGGCSDWGSWASTSTVNQMNLKTSGLRARKPKLLQLRRTPTRRVMKGVAPTVKPLPAALSGRSANKK
jgi:titin